MPLPTAEQQQEPQTGRGTSEGERRPILGTKACAHCWGYNGGSLGVLLSLKKKNNIWSLGWRGQNRMLILYEEKTGRIGGWHQKCVCRAGKSHATRWLVCTFSALPTVFMTPSLKWDPQRNPQGRTPGGCFSPPCFFLLYFPLSLCSALSGMG